MTSDIPRLTGHNAGAEPDTSTPGVTWWALMVPCDPPLAVGRTPEEAEERLREVLLHFYRKECDPLPVDPEVRAAIELARWKRGALLSGRALEELTAFLAWKVVSCLTMEEALLRWRQAFPAPEGVDPLAGLGGMLPDAGVGGRGAVAAGAPGGHRARRRPRRAPLG